jgi:Fe-S cluster biogenesis protein NfuA
MSISEEKKNAILEALETVRPYLQADGGDVEYVDYVDDVVHVRLKGACGTCPSAMMTLQMGVEKAIREKLPEIKGVIGV